MSEITITATVSVYEGIAATIWIQKDNLVERFSVESTAKISRGICDIFQFPESQDPDFPENKIPFANGFHGLSVIRKSEFKVSYDMAKKPLGIIVLEHAAEMANKHKYESCL